MRIFPRFVRKNIKTQGRRIRQLRRHLSVTRILYPVELLLYAGILIFSFTGRRAAYMSQFGSRADAFAMALLLLAFGLTHITLRRYLVPAIVRRLSPPAYDERRILLDLSYTARAATNINQLYRLVVRMIGDALRTENVLIFVRDDATGDFICRISSERATVPDEVAPNIAAMQQIAEPNLVLKRDAFVVKRLRHLTAPWNITPQELETWMRALEGASKAEREERARECATLQKIKSRLLLQIKMKNQLIGVLSLGPRRTQHPFSTKDKEMLTSIAGQLALIIENSKLVERMVEEERLRRELELAAEVQQRLFPDHSPTSSALELYGFCQAARKVGGDYYDFLTLENNQIGIAVADVAGKGISAALLMSTVQASLRSQVMASCADAAAEGSIATLVSAINRLICRSTGDASYVTFFYAQFDEITKRLTYVNAGHNPPLLIKSDGGRRSNVSCSALPVSTARASSGKGILSQVGEDEVEEVFALEEELKSAPSLDGGEQRRAMKLTTGGPVIGMFEDSDYQQETIQLQSGDLLLAYTDGVTEALNASGEEFGEERLSALLRSAASSSAYEIRDHIVQRLQDWCEGAQQHDDLTFIIFKVK